MKWVRLILAIAVLAASVPACRKGEKAAAEKAQRYTLKGVIREVNGARSEITVEHEAVPDFMGGMTMAFPVRDDPQVTRLLRPGDKIEATLVVEKERYWLEKILTRGFVGTPLPPAETPSPGKQSAVVTPVPNRGVQPGDPIPDFTLTDQTGKAVRFSQMRGEPVAVTFLYTRCPIATACPMTTAKFSKLDAMLDQKKFGRLLTVTVDPEHDTPTVLAAYAKMVGAKPKRWQFLTGDPVAVAQVASSFGVMYYPEKGQVVHTQAVAVVDPKGRLATIYYGEHWEPEHILRDLEKAKNG
ncbi:MAG TPA: SCO family protein [Thermoanaerobaculia bacterium]|nr:SCO family protein [Thermoanaerobaculia bacterium]